ncbi:uncharacterized protein EI97DRAFT_29141 [Westerdykella ornata]|uniref:C2H2-type domain-containing protein n=1 Tax=Westerdykella ornata TaxID=318751 RepID=A0A6A6JXT2_WESOR|nr:uncharacterized protein EI97DRAFT_29141 [Westerdykella ornata]KAF2281431.1 hypothetical protein EI97DRAFT_29141 [Westerdykella ornata]
MIRHRFPKADPLAITQHARMNCFRFITLQSLRRKAEEEAPRSVLDAIESSPRTVTQTMFHDSGLGKSDRHEGSSFAKGDEVTYTKFLPKFPEAGALGEHFDCSVCFRKVQIPNENAWTTHVIEDLLPYACIFPDCRKSTQPFRNRNLWEIHLLQRSHRTNMWSPDMTCKLCNKIVSGGYRPHIAHAESHLIEIALCILPTDGDPDPKKFEQAGAYLPEYKVRGSSYAYERELPSVSSDPSQGNADSSKSAALEKAFPHVQHGVSNTRVATGQRNFESREKVARLVSDEWAASDSDSVPYGRIRKRQSASVSHLKAARRSPSPSIHRRGTDRSQKYERPKSGPFLCPLTLYGCQPSFFSKNEWKRHVATQHINLGFWRCDLCPKTIYTGQSSWNDFNRKDLFLQHLRRMHARAPRDSPGKAVVPATEENWNDHVKRCYQELRTYPTQASCPFCDRSFTGPDCWGERMEHVSRHMEQHATLSTSALDPKQWRSDPELEKYLLREGIISQGEDGDLRLGDGRPLRSGVAHGDGAEKGTEGDPDDQE